MNWHVDDDPTVTTYDRQTRVCVKDSGCLNAASPSWNHRSLSSQPPVQSGTRKELTLLLCFRVTTQAQRG